LFNTTHLKQIKFFYTNYFMQTRVAIQKPIRYSKEEYVPQ